MAVQMLRNYGQTEKYHHAVQGFNHRLDSLQAAVLRVKLAHLDEWNAARRQHAADYRALLAGVPVVLPSEACEWNGLSSLRHPDRTARRAADPPEGTGHRDRDPLPDTHPPAARLYRLGLQERKLPVTEEQAEQVLSLPMYAELTQEMIEYVAEAIQELVS